MLSFFIGVFVLWAMSVELDMQHLNKTIESGDQISYFKFFYKQLADHLPPGGFARPLGIAGITSVKKKKKK